MQLKRIENNAGNILMSLNTILSEKKKKKRKAYNRPEEFSGEKIYQEQQLVIDFIIICI